MRRALFASVAVALILSARPAIAATFTLNSFSVSLHEEDPGLVVYAADPAATPFSFELAGIGAQQTFTLFRLGTGEGFVNWEDGEDTTPYPISVEFEFSEPAPAFGGTAHGTTTGVVNTSNSFWAFLDPCWKVYGGCGKVQWANPTLLDFGFSGVLSITLSERQFRAGSYSLIDATFKWVEGELDNPNPDVQQIPEPGLMVLTALGLAVGAARRRRALI